VGRCPRLVVFLLAFQWASRCSAWLAGRSTSAAAVWLYTQSWLSSGPQLPYRLFLSTLRLCTCNHGLMVSPCCGMRQFHVVLVGEVRATGGFV
jgi:hypothetical protein